MILLQIGLVLAIFSIINCFQFAAAILAKQIGIDFWRWFWISLFLPIISMIILLFLWDTNEQPVAHS
jgi:uncharacterized membrane protein YvlD (DUF360 family)